MWQHIASAAPHHLGAGGLHSLSPLPRWCGQVYRLVGGSRLGAWEAVVFGAPHVESALASVSAAGLPVVLPVATEAAVEISVLLTPCQ